MRRREAARANKRNKQLRSDAGNDGAAGGPRAPRADPGHSTVHRVRTGMEGGTQGKKSSKGSLRLQQLVRASATSAGDRPIRPDASKQQHQQQTSSSHHPRPNGKLTCQRQLVIA